MRSLSTERLGNLSKAVQLVSGPAGVAPGLPFGYMGTIVVCLTISHGWTEWLPFINKASVNNLARMFIRIRVVTQVNFLKSRGNQEEHTTQSTDSLGNPGLRMSSPRRGVCPGALPPPFSCLTSPASLLPFPSLFASLHSLSPQEHHTKEQTCFWMLGPLSHAGYHCPPACPQVLIKMSSQRPWPTKQGFGGSCKDATLDQLGFSLLLPFCVTLVTFPRLTVSSLT